MWKYTQTHTHKHQKISVERRCDVLNVTNEVHIYTSSIIYIYHMSTRCDVYVIYVCIHTYIYVYIYVNIVQISEFKKKTLWRRSRSGVQYMCSMYIYSNAHANVYKYKCKR